MLLFPLSLATLAENASCRWSLENLINHVLLCGLWCQGNSLGWRCLRKPRKGQSTEHRQKAESRTMLTHLLESSTQTGNGGKLLGPTQEGVLTVHPNWWSQQGSEHTALWEVVWQPGDGVSLEKADHFLWSLPSAPWPPWCELLFLATPSRQWWTDTPQNQKPK